MSKRIMHFFMAFIIVFNILPPVRAENGGGAVSTADELIGFLENCRSDAYSSGKSFVLMNDIDLQGKKLSPAEIFCGIFDGNGHEIKNAELELNGADGALFKEIAEGAEVRRLKLGIKISQRSADDASMNTDKMLGDLIKNAGISGVSPTENTGITGGLVSVNRGTVSECFVSGYVGGKKLTGGIAGKNDDTGIIDSCENDAEISGTASTGGIAGENYGRIRKSSNNGKINIKAEEITIDTGGICGYNEGVTQACTNKGDVGCKGYGTNTGGICGKQSGCILECINNGAVSGKKNTAGVVGLFVPYSDIDAAADELKEEAEKKKNDIKNEAEDIEQDIKDELDDIKDDLKISSVFDRDKDGSNKLTDSAGGVLDSVARYIDSASKRADDNASHGSDKVLDSIAGYIDSAADEADRNGQSSRDMKSDISDILRDAADTIENSLSDTKNIDRLSDETIDLLKDLDSQLMEITGSVVDNMNEENNMNENIDKLMDSVVESIDSGTVNSERTSRAMADALDSIDINMSGLDSLSSSLRSVSRTIDRLMRGLEDELGDISDVITAPFKRLDDLVNGFAANTDKIKAKLEALKAHMNELNGLLDELKKYIPDIKPKQTPDVEAGSGTIIGRVMDIFTTTAYAEDKKLLDEIFDTDAIKEEVKKIISVDVALDRNVAGEYADNALVRYCCNFGDIIGTSNTGGIAGTMGIESLKTNGDTVTLPDGKPIVSDMAMKAVINLCVNDGSVISESDRCGGIAGNGNIGIIKNCLGAGMIGEEDCEYAGAVAGDANASVMFCIGAAEINGKNDLGGIAGRGNNIHSSYSISVLNENAERIGAIAGSAEGDVKNNFFIDEGIGGIGGKSFEKNAEGIKYEDMTGSDKLPEKIDMLFNDDWYVGSNAFPQLRALAENDSLYAGDIIKAKSSEYASTDFRVEFIVDGECVKSFTKSYGDKLSEDEIPPLEKREKLYPRWDRDTSKPIIRHTEFNAVYDDAVSTITSGEEPPLILVEGVFDDNSSVDIRETDLNKDFGEDYSMIKSYDFDISPETDRNGSFRVHIYDKNGGTAVGILENGVPQIVEAERDGSYLVCELSAPGDIVVLKSKGAFPWWIYVSIPSFIAAALAIFIFMKHGKRNAVIKLPPASSV